MPLRVLNVITRLNIGGATPVVLALADGLQRRGHTALVVAGRPQPSEGNRVDEARARGIEVVEVPTLRRNPHPADDVRTLWALRDLYQHWRPDVVFTHMSKAGALGRLVGWWSGVPTVHTYHGKGFDVFSGPGRAVTLALERRLARLGAASVVVSDIQREEFLALGIGSPARLRTIRVGVHLAPFVAASAAAASGDRPLRAALGLPADAVLLGVVGRVVAIKGHAYLLRACAALAAARPHLHLAVIGDGDARAEVEALSRRLGLEARVHFLGWRADIPALTASLDLVVVPTAMDFEGVPLSVIEAQAAARPVIATRVGGVADTVHDGETGWLVPPRDAAALSATIDRVLDAPATATAVGLRAQAHVQRLFGVDRFIDETERLLWDVVHRPTR